MNNICQIVQLHHVVWVTQLVQLVSCDLNPFGTMVFSSFPVQNEGSEWNRVFSFFTIMYSSFQARWSMRMCCLHGKEHGDTTSLEPTTTREELRIATIESKTATAKNKTPTLELKTTTRCPFQNTLKKESVSFLEHHKYC